jgi:beta-glucosidase
MQYMVRVKAELLFPQQIGMAATFNTEIVKKGLKFLLTRLELLLFLVFSPDLDLPRNPSWSRIWESLEKMLIVIKNGVAMISGFEGDNVSPNIMLHHV